MATQDLLGAAALIQKGVGAETILKILVPIAEQQGWNLLSRLASCKGHLEDFLELRAEAIVVKRILAELTSAVTDAESASSKSGVAFPGRNSLK